MQPPSWSKWLWRKNVDSPQSIETAVEWFFGCGGNHLGLRRELPRLRCVAACEIEAYAIANMVAKMEAGLLDEFPVWTDCKTFPCEVFRGLVDLFIASYPCQGFSAAGLREGQKDPRFLWPWVLRAVVIIQPRWIFFENVEGHISLGLATVLSDLEEAGYRTTWGVFSAAEVGAPHVRKRVFILGYAKNERHGTRQLPIGAESAHTVSSRASMDDSFGFGCGASGANSAQTGSAIEAYPAGELAYAYRCGGGENCQPPQFRPSGIIQPSVDCWNPNPTQNAERQWPSGPGEPQRGWEPPRTTQSGLGGGSDGFSPRVDRLRLLGNAVVPATAAIAWRTLYHRLTSKPF